MPYTIEQFATQIKDKYPEYKDWDNEYLTRQVITKYPEYKDWVSLPVKPVEEVPAITTEEEIFLREGYRPYRPYAIPVLTPAERQVFMGKIGRDISAALTELGRGAVAGFTLGYVDIEPHLERIIPGYKEAKKETKISPIAARIPGLLIGGMANWGAVSKSVGAGLSAIPKYKTAGPLTQLITQQAITGSIVGAAGPEKTPKQRAKSAAKIGRAHV